MREAEELPYQGAEAFEVVEGLASYDLGRFAVISLGCEVEDVGQALQGVVVVGCDFVCDGFTPENTDVGPVCRAAKIESVIEVSMKMIADQVVAFDRTEAAPRGPNAV